MAHFSALERIHGMLSFLKAEVFDARLARYQTLPDIDLTGKVVFITGATSGIGRECARQLAASGATLIIAARSEKRGRLCIAEIIQETSNPNITYEYLDLCDFASVHALADKFVRENRQIDILLNCAGLGNVDSSIFTKDGNELMMQTNYLGPYLLTQKLLPLIISSGAPSKPSRIINVVSEAHYTCPPFDFEDINNTSTLLHPSLQYPLSKFLWVVATMGLADQLSDKNVVVHGVCPGITITEFWDKFPIWQKQIPMTLRFLGIGKTVLEAAEIVLLPTVSDDAELCTGVYWANMDKYLAQARVYDRELQTSIMEKTNKLLGL